MMKSFRVLKPPESGYFVVGKRTFPVQGAEIAVEISEEMRDLLNLLEDGSIDFVREKRATKN